MTDTMLTIAVRAADCHPTRPVRGRGLCSSCYETARRAGTLHRHQTQHTVRSRMDFIADYRLLRAEGYTRRQIAERLGMKYDAVTAAYLRAVRAGDLAPDRRAAA